MWRLFFILQIAFSGSALGYALEVTPKYSLKLDANQWDFGQGSLVPGTAPMNLYSNRKIKDHQIVYEDLFLVKDTVLSRLPANCLKQINQSHLTEGQLCQFSKEEKSVGKHSLTVISLFNTEKKNIMRVRSIYIVGQKKEVALFEKDLKKNLTSELKSGSRK